MTLQITRLLKMMQMIQMIPRAPQRKSAAEFHEALEALGYEISRRQVERDLLHLQSAFPLSSDDEKKRGWFWDKETELPFSGMGMDNHAALVFKLAERYLVRVFPKSTLRKLSRHFSEADKVLNGSHTQQGKRWLDLVRFLEPGVGIIPPEVDEHIEDAVSKSLVEDCVLAITYLRRDGEKKTYGLYVRGLVFRLGVAYVVAHYEGSRGAHFFALHRMREASCLQERAPSDGSFYIDEFLQSGAFGFSKENARIKVVLRFSKNAGAHLLESKLSVDQNSEILENGFLRVTASLANNEEMRWWLLGFGPGVEVLEPADLRSEICELLRKSLAQYL